MAWTESRASSNELQRCIRDLVALSTLPAAWQNYDIRQTGSSIVAALTSMLDADLVFITLAYPGNQSITELSGNNLRPADLTRVRPFVTSRHDGMGPGLSICRSIIETHDHQLIATPNPGGGTIFRFTLPSSGAPDGN